MKFHFLIAAGLILIASQGMATAASPQTSLHVMLDPGHGGADSGAVAFGQREADLVLEIAQRLQKKLAQSHDFQVSLTRERDQKLQLQERVRKSELAQADLFVSLHANSSPDPRARGMEIYFQNHLPPDDETLLLAALENQRELLKESASNRGTSLSKKNDIAMIVEDLRRSSRVRSSRRLSLKFAQNWNANAEKSPHKVRQAPFHVVTRISIPSVLIELGFLTNKNDREQLKRPEVQDRIVENLYAGLVDFRKQMNQNQ